MKKVYQMLLLVLTLACSATGCHIEETEPHEPCPLLLKQECILVL